MLKLEGHVSLWLSVAVSLVRRQNDLQSKKENLSLLRKDVMLNICLCGNATLCLILKTPVSMQAVYSEWTHEGSTNRLMDI